MLVEDLMLKEDILDVLEYRCWSVEGRLSHENQKTILLTS